MYGEIDWKKAACRGMDTEWFYTPMSELLSQGISYRTLRRVCFSCPIWEECLKYAVQEQPYGFWGGLSEEERKHIYNGTHPKSHKQLEKDLQVCKVKLKEVQKIVKSVTRKFSYSSRLDV